jgi:hypothetical protein
LREPWYSLLDLDEGVITVANYLLLYKGGGEMPSTPEAQKAAMDAWGAWFVSMGGGVVDGGNPIGPSASVAGDGSIANGLTTGYTGYSVIAADDLASAVAKTKGCPILTHGGTVEVYETFNAM